MKNIERMSATARAILRGLLIAGVLYIALSSPAGVRKFYRAIGRQMRNNRERYRLRLQLLRLRDKQLISWKEKDGTIELELTENGKREALHFNPEMMALPRTPHWDRKWRIIAFDIPESKRKGRDALREMMQELGATQLQKSLWVWPYECRKEIDFIAELFGVGKYVHYIVAESTTADSHLKSCFQIDY